MMTLAELQALTAFVAPHQAGALSPVLALVPLYAIRSAKGIDAVYAMPAIDAISEMVDVLPGLITTEMQASAREATAHIERTLDPQSLRTRMLAKMAKAA